jgi:hypothetical protein
LGLCALVFNAFNQTLIHAGKYFRPVSQLWAVMKLLGMITGPLLDNFVISMGLQSKVQVKLLPDQGGF